MTLRNPMKINLSASGVSTVSESIHVGPIYGIKLA